eukprot:CAMPEP_0113726808 /NCGR_PEP_ID=MMETSP0038_2-20120614/40693_1 /TAXON_ID=2898 /ORGANISM="Cryptomonas paramecium" /LENGTH=195 /DNA_ID=CAMNT_0000657567 /DNA_START=289 /DNA_END=874 /DNA_ORIENTATION=+ /assembly_acc=CAM_ASM_000170
MSNHRAGPTLIITASLPPSSSASRVVSPPESQAGRSIDQAETDEVVAEAEQALSGQLRRTLKLLEDQACLARQIKARTLALARYEIIAKNRIRGGDSEEEEEARLLRGDEEEWSALLEGGYEELLGRELFELEVAARDRRGLRPAPGQEEEAIVDEDDDGDVGGIPSVWKWGRGRSLPAAPQTLEAQVHGWWWQA